MDNRYKKYYMILIAVVAVIFISLYSLVRVKSASIKDIDTAIVSSTDVSVMDKGDEEKLKKLYYLNITDINEFTLYAPKSNMEANEILVIEAKDKAALSTIKSKVQQRMSNQSSSFKDYRPDQYEIIKHAILREEGLKLICVISKDSSNIIKAINHVFK